MMSASRIDGELLEAGSNCRAALTNVKTLFGESDGASARGLAEIIRHLGDAVIIVDFMIADRARQQRLLDDAVANPGMERVGALR
jgi:hypothetical protein